MIALVPLLSGYSTLKTKLLAIAAYQLHVCITCLKQIN